MFAIRTTAVGSKEGGSAGRSRWGGGADWVGGPESYFIGISAKVADRSA